MVAWKEIPSAAPGLYYRVAKNTLSAGGHRVLVMHRPSGLLVFDFFSPAVRRAITEGIPAMDAILAKPGFRWDVPVESLDRAKAEKRIQAVLDAFEFVKLPQTNSGYYQLKR